MNRQWKFRPFRSSTTTKFSTEKERFRSPAHLTWDGPQHRSKLSNHAMQNHGHDHNHFLLCVFQTKLSAVCTPQISHGIMSHSSWTVQPRPSVSLHRKPAHVWDYEWYGSQHNHGYSSDMSGKGNQEQNGKFQLWTWAAENG